MLSKTAARKVLKAHQEWRRGRDNNMQPPELLSEAIDALCEPPAMAQALRDAALHWPQFMSHEDFQVLSAFLGDVTTRQGKEEHDDFWCCIYGWEKLQSRTFILFVAEALE